LFLVDILTPAKTPTDAPRIVIKAGLSILKISEFSTLLEKRPTSKAAIIASRQIHKVTATKMVTMNVNLSFMSVILIPIHKCLVYDSEISPFGVSLVLTFYSKSQSLCLAIEFAFAWLTRLSYFFHAVSLASLEQGHACLDNQRAAQLGIA